MCLEDVSVEFETMDVSETVVKISRKRLILLQDEIATLTRRNGILQQELDDMVKSKQEMSRISELRRDVIKSIVDGMDIDELRKKLPSVDTEGLFALHLLNK